VEKLGKRVVSASIDELQIRKVKEKEEKNVSQGK